MKKKKWCNKDILLIGIAIIAVLAFVLIFLRNDELDVSGKVVLWACTDSDLDSKGNDNYYMKGTTKGYITRWIIDQREDACLDSINLREYYCKGRFIKFKGYKCAYGCEYGACKKEMDKIVYLGE